MTASLRYSLIAVMTFAALALGLIAYRAEPTPAVGADHTDGSGASLGQLHGRGPPAASRDTGARRRFHDAIGTVE